MGHARATLTRSAVVAFASAELLGCMATAEVESPRSPSVPVEGTLEAPSPPPRQEIQEGYATWYGAAFAGRRTASGEPFDPNRLTAAHRTLPFGTWVDVTRVDTGKTVRVRITDRGPFGHADRIIDLSRGAADRIDLVRTGVTRVQLRVVEAP